MMALITKNDKWAANATFPETFQLEVGSCFPENKWTVNKIIQGSALAN